MHLFPAAEVTLPWHGPGTRRHGKPHTAKLLFTTEDGRALNRNGFNQVWRDARAAAGLADDRVNGCHMLRHVFASTLVSRGIDPRTVAEYMGHTDGGALVLKTYSHLMPDAEDRARRALEEALSEATGRDEAGRHVPSHVGALLDRVHAGAADRPRRHLGIAVLSRAEHPGPYDEAHLRLVADLAARAAVQIDNARLYTREHDAAVTLQRSLLPRDIPRVAGLDIAYRYLPA